MTAQPALALVKPFDPEVVTRPTVFAVGFPTPDPVSFATLADAAERVRALLAGRPFELRIGRAAFPGWADFAQISVRCEGVILACVGGPWTTWKAQAEDRDTLKALLA